MSGKSIIDYARIVVFLHGFKEKFAEDFARRDDILATIEKRASAALERYEADLSDLEFETLVDQLFSELSSNGALERDEDPFAGEYLRPIDVNIRDLRNNALNGSSIYERAGRIGHDRFFHDVFDAHAGVAGVAQFSLPTEEGATLEVSKPSVGVTLSAEVASALVSEIEKAEKKIAGLAISQDEICQIRAHLLAAKALAEAPSPPADQIWDQLHKAGTVTSLASFIFMLLGLFS